MINRHSLQQPYRILLIIELSTFIGSQLGLYQATKCLESTFHFAQDNVAPLKSDKVAPWFIDTSTLKQTTQKLECKLVSN